MPDRQDDLNPSSDLAPFADALKRLAPQPAHLSRDALLFEAGKASAHSRIPAWVWPSTTALFAALSVVLAGFATSPSTPHIEYVYVNVPQPMPDPPPSTDTIDRTEAPKAAKPRSAEDHERTRMLQVRRDVLRFGVDMLPEPKPTRQGPSADAAAHEVIVWLNLPPGTFATHRAQPKKPAPEEDDK
jgi:hypothetical protein